MKKYELAVSKLRADLYRDADMIGTDAPNLWERPAVVNMTDLIRKAASYKRLQELACNQELTPAQVAREKRLEQEIAELAAKLNTTAEFNGDPRGHCVYLKKPGSKTFYNTWGGLETGYGVGH